MSESRALQSVIRNPQSAIQSLRPLAYDLRPPFTARLIVDPPAPGPWNMAVDELLLGAAADEGVLSLRFYEWSEPTLSLGYFQRYADRDRHPASRECAVVRRQSGGGAILHDRELTYSLAIPGHHPLAQNTKELYLATHQSLVEWLADWQIAADVTETPSTLPPDHEPFLCFERRAYGDVLVAPGNGSEGKVGDKRLAANGRSPFKILGSAQRRHRRAILQHGSILLARSPAAPELPGLADVSGRAISTTDLLGGWRDKLLRVFPHPLEPARLPQCFQAAAGQLAQAKYCSSEWNRRR